MTLLTNPPCGGSPRHRSHGGFDRHPPCDGFEREIGAIKQYIEEQDKTQFVEGNKNIPAGQEHRWRTLPCLEARSDDITAQG